MKQVLFINLPSPSMIIPKWSIPNSLLFLKSFLDSKGVDSDIIDMADFKEDDLAILPLNYDYFCITCYTYQHETLKRVSKYIKTNANALIIVGGRHVTYLSKEILNDMDIDVIVRGEGEQTIYELVSGKNLEDILGITYRFNEKIIYNEDRPLIKNLDDLPYPSFDCLDLLEYPGNYINAEHSRFRIGVMFSRGCYGKCNFCTSPSFWGCNVRFYSYSWIKQYIEYIVSRGIYDLHINDDNFLIHKDFEKICLLLKHEKIRFKCLGASVNITEAKAKCLFDSGCYKISLGVESGSNRVLQLMNKNSTVELNEKAINILKDVGLFVESFLMIGFPGENREDIWKTAEFIKRSRSDIFSMSIFVPFPGTAIWSNPENYGWKISNDNDYSQYLHLGKKLCNGSLVIDNSEIEYRRKLLHNAMREKDIVYTKVNGQK